jgi:hypothetical protein
VSGEIGREYRDVREEGGLPKQRYEKLVMVFPIVAISSASFWRR